VFLKNDFFFCFSHLETSIQFRDFPLIRTAQDFPMVFLGFVVGFPSPIAIPGLGSAPAPF
jgi:hypothetical protein